LKSKSAVKNANTVAALGVAVSVLLGSASASANGRFPRAQRLVQSAERADIMALYGTYGLLVTQDGGKSWNHICEAATGTYTGEDPLLEIMPGTRIVARTETALVASTESWCNFRSVYGNGKDSISDITRDPTQPNTILALTGSYDMTAGFSSKLIESADAGKTWSPPVDIPPTSFARGLSLDVAPSEPNRIYATGLDAMGKGILVVSDDRGKHWSTHAIAGADASATPYLAVVSAKNKDLIFVRTDAYAEMDGIDTANDALLVSKDAGATWAMVLTRHAKLFGFALSPDEKTLLAGYGDPQISATTVDPVDAGLYRADLTALLGDLAHGEDKFEKIFNSSITCLRWSSAGLFACTLYTETGFEIGRAADASFAASAMMPFSPLLLLNKVTPLPCGQGTSAYGCYTDPVYGFPFTCAAIGASCDASAPPPGTMSGVFTGQSGAGGASSHPDAGVSRPAGGGGGSTGMGGMVTTSPTGGTSSGGQATTGGAGSAGVAGAAGATPAPARSSASGCQTGARGRVGSVGAVLFLSAVGALRRRLKRR
jgi:hypothetical protein